MRTGTIHDVVGEIQSRTVVMEKMAEYTDDILSAFLQLDLSRLAFDEGIGVQRLHKEVGRSAE